MKRLRVSQMIFALFFLTLQTLAAHTISGTVTHQFDGSPIAGTWILVCYTNGEFYFPHRAETNIDGTYSIPDIPAGTYIIHADGKTGRWETEKALYNEAYYPNSPDIGGASRISLTEDKANINFVLSGHYIIGTITEAGTGKAVSGQHIRAFNTHWDEVKANFSNNAGEYYIGRLDPGRYFAGSVDPPYLPKYYDNVDKKENATLIDLNTRVGLSNVNFSLTPGLSLSGKVTDDSGNPIYRTSLGLLDQATLNWWEHILGFGELLTDKDGAYSFAGLLPGTYYLVATGRVWDEQSNDMSQVYKTIFYNNTTEPDKATPIVLNQSVSNINFVLKKGLSISGLVVEKETGQAIAHTHVTLLTPSCQEIVSQSTNDNGMFNLGGLDAGDYILRASGEVDGDQGSEQRYAMLFYDNAQTFETATTIHLTQDLSGLVLQLSSGFSISGRVICRNNGKALNNIPVELLSPANETLTGCRTNHNGDYVLSNVLPGDYVVFAWPHDTYMYKGEYYKESTTFRKATVIHVDHDIKNIDFTLERENGVYGYVTRWDNGACVPEPQILLYRPDWTLAVEAKAQQQGFYMACTDPGDYYVKATGCIFWDFGDYFWWNQLYHPMFHPNVYDSLLAQLVHVDSTVQVNFILKDKDVFVREHKTPIQQTFQLLPNYPNPCNPGTTFSYTLDKTGHVQLTLYDIQGKRIDTLVDERQEAGEHTIHWDGRGHRGESLPSGVYVYKLQTAKGSCARKLILVK